MKTLKQQVHGLKFLLMLSVASATGLYPALYAEDSGKPSPEAQPAAVSSKPQGTGNIGGQVYVPEQDRYLSSVRVTIDGTDKTTFTDDTGSFYFSDVPVGSVKVIAVFSGFSPQTKTVTVAAGTTATADIDFIIAPKKGSDDDVVKLEKFSVVAGRDDLGSAIAEQEKRYASNMKTVVSTDDFGGSPTGNIGEFLRNIPGVELDTDGGGEARMATLGGASTDYVPIQMNGMDFASASTEGLSGRTIQLQNFSVNNVSRMEVSFSPTPETAGGSLGGTINMVPRGAFESKRAKLDFSTYLIMSGREFTLGRTPGPLYEKDKKTKPSWNFVYVVPVSKKFGFTVSGGYNYFTNISNSLTYTWRGIDSAYDPVFTTPGTPNPFSKPYISGHAFSVDASYNQKASAGITMDWRLGRADRLSFGLQYSNSANVYAKRHRSFSINRSIDEAQTTLEHTVGEGYLRSVTNARKRENTLYSPSLRYSHIGSLWKIEAAVGLSRDDSEYTDSGNGFMYEVVADRYGADIVIDKYDGEMKPHNVQAFIHETNTPIDFRSLDEYVIDNTQLWSLKSFEEVRTFYANAQRSFTILGVPLILKAGVDIRQRIKDQEYEYATYRYLGPDGIFPYDVGGSKPNASTTPDASDNDAGAFAETIPYPQVDKLVGLGSFEFVNNAMVYNLYKTHPNYFQKVTNEVTYTQSRRMEETISSGYVRGDISFFDNRLTFIGGVRMEETHVTGRGPLRVPTETGVLGPWIKRGSNNTITFNNWFPSVNAVYKLGAKQNWQLRASWFSSIGRPDPSIYNGAIRLPTLGSDPFNDDNYIQLSSGNALLKPWTAQTWRGEIVYYFPKGGNISLAGFTRDYTNRHVGFVTPLTEEIRAFYNLPEAYMDYFVTSRYNSPNKLTVREFTLSYNQKLKFLPSWARGLGVSGGVTVRDKSGADAKNVAGMAYTPRSYRAGLSYERGRLIVRMDGTYRPKYVMNFGPSTVENGVVRYGDVDKRLSVSIDFRMTKSLYFFANGSNFFDDPNTTEVRGPSTPGASKYTSVRYYGSTYTFGIKGKY